jgi:DNA-binding response OmpR family regulator
MPLKDGVEIIITLREMHSAVRIVALSGATGHETLLKVADIYGADAVLSKPFTNDGLLKVIKAEAVAA